MSADRERRLRDLAVRQDGLATTRQLVEEGWSPDAVERAVRRGRFLRLHRGVVLAGPGPVTARVRARAALLAVGDDAALDRGWAAWHLGFGPFTGGPVTVATAVRGRRSRDGIAVRCVRRLDPPEVLRVDGLRVTSPERTISDLAASVGPAALGRLVDQALVARRVTPDDLRRHLGRHGGTRGVPALRAMLAAHRGATRSELERMFRRLWSRSQLPAYEANARVAGITVDAFWPEHRVVVELDGRGFHDAVPTRAEADRRRSSRLAAAGYLVVRVGARRVREEPVALIAELALILGRASAHGDVP
jgi:very-short-patch-repair endonuclease